MIELGAKGRTELLFLCTHLDYRPPDEERMNSALTINELIKKRGNEPAIIAGDFNATPESRLIREFEKEWKIAGGRARRNRSRSSRFRPRSPTAGSTTSCIRPADKWEVVEVRVLDEPVASDHRPVLAVLRRVTNGGSARRNRPSTISAAAIVKRRQARESTAGNSTAAAAVMMVAVVAVVAEERGAIRCSQRR